MYLKGKVTCIDVGSIWASLVSVCLLNPLLMELHMHTYAGDVIWQIHDHTKQIIRQWLGIKPKQSLWNQSMSACCSICLWITYIPFVAFFIQCKWSLPTHIEIEWIIVAPHNFLCAWFAALLQYRPWKNKNAPHTVGIIYGNAVLQWWGCKAAGMGCNAAVMQPPFMGFCSRIRFRGCVRDGLTEGKHTIAFLGTAPNNLAKLLSCKPTQPHRTGRSWPRPLSAVICAGIHISDWIAQGSEKAWCNHTTLSE